jgi:BirA family biotin operon repressor/biotin-[acetyl-CoA-carboxylase] ligase
VVALAVADAVEAATGCAPALKWPNDVLLGGRKAGGILVEARSAGGPARPVAGIGLNVHHRPEDLPAALSTVAGSLESVSGRRIDRSELLANLLGCLEATLDEERAGTLDLVDRFGRRDALRDREVVVEGPGDRVTGVARGIDGNGRLLLDRGPSGTRAVQAGEATLRSVPA